MVFLLMNLTKIVIQTATLRARLIIIDDPPNVAVTVEVVADADVVVALIPQIRGQKFLDKCSKILAASITMQVSTKLVMVEVQIFKEAALGQTSLELLAAHGHPAVVKAKGQIGRHGRAAHKLQMDLVVVMGTMPTAARGLIRASSLPLAKIHFSVVMRALLSHPIPLDHRVCQDSAANTAVNLTLGDPQAGAPSLLNPPHLYSLQ